MGARTTFSPKAINQFVTCRPFLNTISAPFNLFLPDLDLPDDPMTRIIAFSARAQEWPDSSGGIAPFESNNN